MSALMSEQRGYGVPDLPSDGGEGLLLRKDEFVRKAHAPCRLTDRDRPVLRRVKITALLGLVELGPDGHRRPVPPEATEDVSRSPRFVPPAPRYQISSPAGVETALHL